MEDENDDWGWAPCPSVMGYFPNLEQPGPVGPAQPKPQKRGFHLEKRGKGRPRVFPETVSLTKAFESLRLSMAFANRR